VSFGWPFALVALLVVPAALAFAVVIRRRPAPDAVAFTNLDVLATVVGTRRGTRPWLPVALLLLALSLASAALARPQLEVARQVDDATVVLLVDVSGSMQAEDVEPTRLDAATAAMRTFLDRLPERFRVGLVQFSATAEVIERPTHDRDRIREDLAFLAPDAGTAIGDGLATATSVLKQSLARGPERSGKPVPGAIVLLSDGTQSFSPPRLQPLEVAKRTRTAGIRVYTVALGTPQGFVEGPGHVRLPVIPDPELMGEIAETTRGDTYAATSATRTAEVFGTLSAAVGRETTRHEITSWFALAAAGALLAALVLGRLLAGAVGDQRI
jgi:Ca-activated chloride channel family protein